MNPTAQFDGKVKTYRNTAYQTESATSSPKRCETEKSLKPVEATCHGPIQNLVYDIDPAANLQNILSRTQKKIRSTKNPHKKSVIYKESLRQT